MASSYVIDIDGNMYTCGKNTYGQLGLGDNLSKIYSFELIPANTRFKQVSSSNDYIVAISEDDYLYGCGNNTSLQLGIHNTPVLSSLKIISPNIQFSRVSCGWDHIVAITLDGDTYVCGMNQSGQLGLGDDVNRNSLTPLQNNIPFKSVTACCDYTVCVDYYGDIYGCGTNDHNQLGLHNRDDIYDLEYIPSPGRIVQVVGSSNGFATIVLTEDGHLYACGTNMNGQLGLPVERSPMLIPIPVDMTFSQISCGYMHTIALGDDGVLYGCGSNKLNQIGLSPANKVPTLTLIPSNSIFTQVACGYEYTLALSVDGRIYACGSNEYGQLGIAPSHRDTMPRLSECPTSLNGYISTLMNTDPSDTPQIKSAMTMI